MTEFEIKHGLSQDEPGPLEPVDLAASPVSTVQDERQAFETWADDEGFPLDCDFFEVSGQYYDHPDTQLAYNIWRAARASVPAAGDALDAARYRWLRNEVLVDGEVNDSLYVHVDSPEWPTRWALVGDELDTALDAVIAAQRQGDA